MNLLPSVIEVTSRGERILDVHSRLLRDRTIMLNGVIDDDLSTSICMQLLYLETTNPEKAIKMYINSPGGSVTSGMVIYDTMQYIQPNIETVVVGIAASMSSVIAQAGAAGKRFIMPHARVMIHQPLGSVSGSVSDAEITYKEMLHYKNLIANLYAKHNSMQKDYDYFMTLMEKDTYFGAQDSIEMGVTDAVVEKNKSYSYTRG